MYFVVFDNFWLKPVVREQSQYKPAYTDHISNSITYPINKINCKFAKLLYKLCKKLLFLNLFKMKNLTICNQILKIN